MPRPEKLFALLIGINDYDPQSHEQGVMNLQGCVNDVNAINQLITSHFNYLSPNIKTLRNQEATRDNIIQAFRQHLIKNAAKNTVLVFYFSGHGSRQKMARELQSLRKQAVFETTLVCYDSRVQEENFKGNDLADIELAILIQEASKREAQIVIILDASHSGYDFNYASDVYSAIEMEQGSNEEVTSNGLEKYLDGKYLTVFEQNGQFTIPQSNHLLLAACQEGQYPKETSFDGIKRGVFTYYLEQIVQEYPNITYFDLFFRLKRIVSEAEFQNPMRPQDPFLGVYGNCDPHTQFFTGLKP